MPATPIPRQLHVVYCLTSSGGDLYEAMTRVSLATLRLTNPSARVTIACDQQTHQALQASGSQLFHEADAVRGFPTPDGPPTYRNRYVKTQLGRLIVGPFLFLDSDTVVRKPLTPLLDLHCDIAAAPNHSRDTLAEQIWSEDQANLDAMGWQVREPYVNGGVIWYGGTTGSRAFAGAWHQNWLANVEATGWYRDQPALNQALSADPEIQCYTLPHYLNAQIGMRSDLAEEAFIWHIYSSTGLGVQDRFNHCCQRLLEGRSLKLPSRAISDLVKASTPELSPTLGSQLRSQLKSKLQSLIKSS
jgi:hypothetical protein